MGENPGGQNPEEQPKEEPLPETKHTPKIEEGSEKGEKNMLSREDCEVVERGLIKLREMLEGRDAAEMPERILLPDTSGRILVAAVKPVLDSIYHDKGLPPPRYDFLQVAVEHRVDALVVSQEQKERALDEQRITRESDSLSGRQWRAEVALRKASQDMDFLAATDPELREMKMSFEDAQWKMYEIEDYLPENQDERTSKEAEEYQQAVENLTRATDAYTTARAHFFLAPEIRETADVLEQQYLAVQKELAALEEEEKALLVQEDEIVRQKKETWIQASVASRDRWHELLDGKERQRLLMIDDYAANGHTILASYRSMREAVNEAPKECPEPKMETFVFYARQDSVAALQRSIPVVFGTEQFDVKRLKDYGGFSFRRASRDFQTVKKNYLEPHVEKRTSTEIDWEWLHELRKQMQDVAQTVLERNTEKNVS